MITPDLTDHKHANIILCGFMGTGKTTVGQLVAAQLGWRFVDTDQVIEAREGRTPRVIFAEDGEDMLRRLEGDLCREMICWRQTVIATGGGIVMNPDNRANLSHTGIVICLEAPAGEILMRLSGEIAQRPILKSDDPLARIDELLAKRTNVYAALPYHVNTADCSPEQVAGAVMSLWSQYSAG